MSAIFTVRRLGFALAWGVMAAVLVWLPPAVATGFAVALVTAALYLLASAKTSARRSLERTDLI
jgi:hypothetical protein